MTEHERLLIEIATDVKWLKCKFEDHLKKHWWFTSIIISAVVGIILVGKFLA